MKLKLTLTIGLLVLVFVNLGYPQVTVTRNILDYNFLGGGARARAMGGAFLAVSDDPSAGSWNPAGLVQLDKYQMGATLYFINPKIDYTARYATYYSFPNSLKQSKSTISFGSVVIPFKLFEKELVSSVLYNQASDIYDKRVYNYLGVYTFYDDSLRIWDKTEEIKGGLDVIVLSLGGKAYKDLSFGLGINVYTGSYEYNSGQLIDYSWDEVSDTSVCLRPYIKGSYSGINFTLGTMYKYQDLRVGAVVKTPFKLKEKDDVQYLVDFIVDGVVNPYSVQSGVIWPVEYKQKWEIPLTIGFGASYQVKGLTLAGDVELRDFSSSKLFYPKKWWDPSSPDTSIALDWNSLTQFRIGGEYLFHTKYGTIPIRAGFRNDPKVFSDLKNVIIDSPPLGTGKENEITVISQDNGDKVTGSIFSLGTGIGWKQIKLDFTYELSQYKTEMSGVNVGVPFDIKDIEKKDNRFMITFTGFF
jgi:hypothetical protein